MVLEIEIEIEIEIERYLFRVGFEASFHCDPCLLWIAII